MSDTFQVIGDDVYMDGWLVARIATNIPATVRHRAVSLMECQDSELLDKIAEYEDATA